MNVIDRLIKNSTTDYNLYYLRISIKLRKILFFIKKIK
jgi:hypothetical protein